MTTQTNKSIKKNSQGRKKQIESVSPPSNSTLALTVESNSSDKSISDHHSSWEHNEPENIENNHDMDSGYTPTVSAATPNRLQTIHSNALANSSNTSTASTTPSSPKYNHISRHAKTIVQAIHESHDGKDDFDDAVLEGDYIHLKTYAKSDGIRVRPRKLHLSKEVLILHPKDLSSVSALQDTMTSFQIPSVNIASINKEDLDMVCSIYNLFIILYKFFFATAK